MKPILFSTEMVQAILEGRKTMTRRVVKPNISDRFILDDVGNLVGSYRAEYPEPYPSADDSPHQPGDILWVRETWNEIKDVPYDNYIYKADGKHQALDNLLGGKSFFKWKPSIFMPKEAARIFLKVTGVRVERVQDITAEDCTAEGINLEWSEELPKPSYFSLAYSETRVKPAFIKEFAKLWNGLNAKRGYTWESNPWVWVIEFERVENPLEN